MRALGFVVGYRTKKSIHIHAADKTLLRLIIAIVILVYYNTMKRAKNNKEAKPYALRTEA